MEIRLILNGALLSLLFVSTTIFAGPFDELDSYNRQQRAADKGFEDFEKEFGEPGSSAPAQVQPMPKSRVEPTPAPLQQTHKPEPEPEPEAEPAQVSQIKQAAAPASNDESENTYSKDGLIFTLKGCKKYHGEVRCKLTVLSESTDETLTLYSSTNFYDNNGNQYNSYQGKIANAAFHWGKATQRLIRGVLTPVEVEFKNVNEKAANMSLLEVKFHTSGPINLEFRNVPFS